MFLLSSGLTELIGSIFISLSIVGISEKAPRSSFAGVTHAKTILGVYPRVFAGKSHAPLLHQRPTHKLGSGVMTV